MPSFPYMYMPSFPYVCTWHVSVWVIYIFTRKNKPGQMSIFSKQTPSGVHFSKLSTLAKPDLSISHMRTIVYTLTCSLQCCGYCSTVFTALIPGLLSQVYSQCTTLPCHYFASYNLRLMTFSRKISNIRVTRNWW